MQQNDSLADGSGALNNFFVFPFRGLFWALQQLGRGLTTVVREKKDPQSAMSRADVCPLISFICADECLSSTVNEISEQTFEDCRLTR